MYVEEWKLFVQCNSKFTLSETNKSLKLIFNFVQQVRWTVTIIFLILRFELDELSDVSKERANHVNACEPKVHPETGSNICQLNIRTLSYNKKPKTENTTKSRTFYWYFTKRWTRNCEEIDWFIVITLLRI